MCLSGWAASCPAIWVSRALIWADSVVSVAVKAAVTHARAAPSAPVAPGGAACSRADSLGSCRSEPSTRVRDGAKWR